MKAGLLTSLAFLATRVFGAPLTELNVPERPEGITSGPGSTLYVSQILSGKVLAVDALTGETVEVVGEQEDREAWGLWYHEEDEQGYLFVAGGGPNYGNGVPEVYLYNVDTGESLAACAPLSLNKTGQGAFVNDVAVMDGKAYVSNSGSDRLMVLDVASAIQGNCSVDEIFLPINFVPFHPEDWGTNGVVPYDFGDGITGLLVSNEADGTVFSVQFTEVGTPRYQGIIGQAEALGADGLLIVDDKLYVTQNTMNKVGVYNITADRNGVLFVTALGALTSELYDTPAVSAAYGGYVYSTNSRFVNQPDIADPANNNVVGVVRRFSTSDSAMDATAEVISVDDTEEGGEADAAATGEDAPSDAPASESEPETTDSSGSNAFIKVVSWRQIAVALGLVFAAV